MKSIVCEITAALSRYIDEYGWSYKLACRLVNRLFDVQYTEAELKKLHKQSKSGSPV